ncbi:unnamed protein product, partial [Prorocentrum cordatum]
PPAAPGARAAAGGSSPSSAQPQAAASAVAAASEAATGVVATGGAASGSRAAAAPDRRPASYDDVEEDPRTVAAVARVSREVIRRAKVAEALNKRTVFVTNLPFKATEQEIRDCLGKAGDVKEVRLSRDKTTARPLGYGHVQFEAATTVTAAVEQCDKVELRGRVMRVAKAEPGVKVEFELPEELREEIKTLMRRKYEGMNLSALKDAWRKEHAGEKLDTAKFGFKNFSSAVKTIE